MPNEQMPGGESCGAKLREWLFRDSTPKTKEATEQIFNNQALDDIMLDSVNDEESQTIKVLMSEYIDLTGDASALYKPETIPRIRAIEKQFATILATAYGRS